MEPQKPSLKNKQILEKCGLEMIKSIKKKKVIGGRAKDAGGLAALKKLLGGNK